MEDKALTARLMKTFLGEAEEHLRALNTGLLALEKLGADAPEQPVVLKGLFRSAHSLKGAAHAVRAAEVETACHKLEGFFSEASHGTTTIDREQFQKLFAMVDSIQAAITELRNASAAAAPAEPRVVVPGGEATGDRSREKAPKPKPAASHVRLLADKLDTLLIHSGEIMIARRRAADRSAEAARLQEEARQWKADWRSIERQLERHLAAERFAADGPHADRAAPTRRQEHAEMVLRRAAARFGQLERDLQRLGADLEIDQRRLGRTASALDGEVRRARMLPFAEACVGLERMVRDLAAAAGKDVVFAIEGADIELDRSVLEGVKDPVMHLVRNALDHGIELPDRRRALGKRPQGHITVSARTLGAEMEVVVADDGAGLDLSAIRRRLEELGLPVPPDDNEAARSAFLPNLSTAKRVTEISGRGVGLDAVRSRIEGMRGRIDIDFAPNAGTRFIVRLPMTLLTVRGLIVRTGRQLFAFEDTAVERLLRVGTDEMRSIEGRRVVIVGGGPVPLVGLAGLLGLPQDVKTETTAASHVLLVRSGNRRVAIEVDDLFAEQEIVVRSLGPRLSGLRPFIGAFSLPTGQLALILNPAELVERALSGKFVDRTAPAEAASAARRRLLVADDSVTTRTLEKSILEAAGYDVMLAADGNEAWRMLQESGADLVVSDVQMPGMDGIDLTRAIRGSSRFRSLPVVLVTGRESEADKLRGLEAGANAYLPKSTFDQTMLLDAVRQIL